jgi:hypothetical protein
VKWQEDETGKWTQEDSGENLSLQNVSASFIVFELMDNAIFPCETATGAIMKG